MPVADFECGGDRMIDGFGCKVPFALESYAVAASLMVIGIALCYMLTQAAVWCGAGITGKESETHPRVCSETSTHNAYAEPIV